MVEHETVPPQRTRPPHQAAAPGPPPAPPGRDTVDGGPPARVRGRVGVLDGLRLVAALLVVAYHFLGTGGGGSSQAWGRPTSEVFPLLHPIAVYGWLGVELFFLISGFVICMSCWDKPLGRFLASRAARLYPAYWFGVLATTLVLTVLPGFRYARGGGTVLTNLTMFEVPLGAHYVDGVYWTLWAELRFYLVFCLVVRKGLTYRRVLSFCLLWTFAAVLGSGTTGVAHSLLMPGYAPLFVTGIAAFLLWRFGHNPLLWGLIGFNWLVYQGELQDRVRGASHTLGESLSWPVAAAVFTALLALLLWLVLGPAGRFNPRWLTTAGALTYPLYLIHEDIGWTVIDRLHGALPDRVLLVVLVTALLGASWLVHRWIERPVGPRLRDALLRAPAGAATARG